MDIDRSPKFVRWEWKFVATIKLPTKASRRRSEWNHQIFEQQQWRSSDDPPACKCKEKRIRLCHLRVCDLSVVSFSIANFPFCWAFVSCWGKVQRDDSEKYAQFPPCPSHRVIPLFSLVCCFHCWLDLAHRTEIQFAQLCRSCRVSQQLKVLLFHKIILHTHFPSFERKSLANSGKSGRKIRVNQFHHQRSCGGFSTQE